MPDRSFFEAVQTFGLAVVLLGVMGIFLWRFLKWLRPWAEKGMDAHLKFIEKTAETNDKLAKTLDNQTISLDAISKNEEKAQRWAQRSVAIT